MSLHNLMITVATERKDGAPGQQPGGIRFTIARKDGTGQPIAPVDCAQNDTAYQAQFVGVESGTYNISAQTVDANGVLIGNATTGEYTIDVDAPAVVKIDFPVAGSLNVQASVA